MSSFEVKNMQVQYIVLAHIIYLYFHDYELALEIEQNGHNDINTANKIKRQKSIAQEFGCKLIVIRIKIS